MAVQSNGDAREVKFRDETNVSGRLPATPVKPCCRPGFRARSRALLLCSAIAGASGGYVAAASGPAPEYGFHLGGNDLATALNELAAQGRIQILFDAKLLGRRRAAALEGRYAVDAALARLLRGTGLEAVAVNPDTYVVKQAAPSGGGRAPIAVDVPPPRSEVELTRIVVSGSNFLRVAAQSVMPVTEITREQIDSSGYATLFDLLKAQPGMQVANQPEAMASSSDSNFTTGASGAAAVALRRLGSKSTLFLVDGRRVAGYGLAQDTTGTVPDLNAIPLAMVERIEILRDGASAIYGSDAVAGVVNILLRRDFSGAEAGIYAGVSSRGDAASRQASVSWGGRAADGIGMFLNVNALRSDPLPGDQRAWYSLDQRRQGLPDFRSLYSYPGNLVYDDGSVVAMPGCAPTSLTADGTCVLDGAKFTTLQNGRDGESLLGRIDVPLGEATRLHVDLRAVDTTQRQHAAPSAAGFLLATTQDASAPQPIELLYSFNDIGPVRETTRSLFSSLVVGIGGESGGWTWSADASTQRNRVDDRIDGLIRSDILRLSVDGERYGFGDPAPSAALLALIAPRAERRGTTKLDELSFDASGAAFALPAGNATVSAGVDARIEAIEQRPGEVLQSGVLLNPAPEYPLSQQRTGAAAYLKFDAPLSDRAEASVAWRAETIAGFAAHLAPTLGASWKAGDALLLRASLSKGQRVPTLQELYQTRSDAPAIVTLVPDAFGPCRTELLALAGQAACRLESTVGGNPALRRETSTTTAWGVVWTPSVAFSLSADAYVSERKDGIGFAPTAYVLAHPDEFPSATRRDAEGDLFGIDRMLVNLARTTTRGIDVEARWDIDARGAGHVEVSMGANYLDALDQRPAPGAHVLRSAGYLDTPRLTAVSTAQWKRGNWIVGANLRYVGSYKLEQYADSGIACASYLAQAGKCSVPPFTLANLNVTYAGVPHWSFMLGVNNLFDHQPRYYDVSAGGYSAAFDDVLGRYYAFRANYRF